MPCQFVIREMLIIKQTLILVGHVTQQSLIIEFSSKLCELPHKHSWPDIVYLWYTKSELSAFITTQSQDHVTACIVGIILFIHNNYCVRSCVIDVSFVSK